MKDYIPKTAINRLTVKLWRRHWQDRTLDSPAGQYVNTKLARLIAAAVRVAECDPDYDGSEFEKTCWLARARANYCISHTADGARAMRLGEIDDEVIDALNRYIEERVVEGKRNYNVERREEVVVYGAEYAAQRYLLKTLY